LLTQERVGLNKPNRLYLLKPNYDIKASHSKELPNSQSNDTENNDTDYIKTESNDTNDLNDNKLTFPS
ncbi:replication protein, partial [Staphylococcus aureus]